MVAHDTARRPWYPPPRCARIARLPDSAFAIVETDSRGRRHRHLPHHDETGALDLAHLHAAYTRLPHVRWARPDSERQARDHLESHRRAAERHRRHVVEPGVIHVHDGDTFYVGETTIRLRGIDTPELGEPKSWEARRRLIELLGAGPVTIVPRAEDVYGRTVADVYVGGRDVSAVLRAEGFAKPGSEIPWWRRPRRPTTTHASPER
ncbi:MAG: thermonuclease family protein [Candidatus Rokubacteria bacterium]|nr:thermonuclease family protein [Candidatus Rokubacteria bacterium]